MKDGCWWRAAPRIALVAAAVAAIAGCSGGSRRHAAPVGSRVTLPVLDPVTIALGRRIYVQNCASCHGERAEGAPHWQQPNARGDLPAPPHDDTGHTWRHDDAMLSQVIKDGLRDPFNKTRELTMPPFGKMLSDAEMADIIVYFKSLWSPEHRIYQEELSRPRQMPKRSR